MLRAYGRANGGVIFCHCRDLRKSSGAPVSPFAGYGSEQVETEQGTPKVYESFHGVRRSFCDDCGTPLLYEDERLPGEAYVMVGAFDGPEPFEPEVHQLIPRKPE
ncbi:MAG: GFA family protein [Actinomycetota bacterium]|nr:GFA family protein [Actinomycetota bacterium]